MRESELLRESTLVRDSWYFGNASVLPPTAPQMDFDEEEPPPSYHEVIVETAGY